MTFSYQGKDLPILLGPDRRRRHASWRCSSRRRKSSTFIDPAAPGRRADHLGRARGGRSTTSGVFAPHWENFAKVWDLIDYPRLLFNTAAIAVISTIGTLLSCTLVAYGFARFQFPGRGLLFTLLIATIFLPAAVTIIPTYTIFVKLGWVGTWLPLLVPTFFANAYDVFLMRQYFMTIPTEMDEAAAIDGAGPVPDALVGAPAAGLAGGHRGRDLPPRLLVERLLRAADLPRRANPDLQTLALGLQRFNGIHYRDPGLIQAGTLMTLVIPVVAFLLTQRFFTRGPRHHRRREVTAAPGRRRRPGRADLRRRASRPPDRPPASTERAARRCSRGLAVRGHVLRPGPLGRGVPGRRRASIAAAGHLVGNHSHYHARMPLLTDAGLAEDIGRGGPGHPRDDRRGPAAVVPLPVRGGRRRPAGPGRPRAPPATGTSAGTSAPRTGSPAAIGADDRARRRRRRARPRRRRGRPAPRLAAATLEALARDRRPAARRRARRSSRIDALGEVPAAPSWT